MAAKLKDLPGIHKPSKPSGKINLKRGEIKKELTPQEVKALCGGKEKYPVYMCASLPGFQLSDAEFIKRMQPNVLKELDLSSNELSSLNCLSEQRKLKRLVVEKNCLNSVSFTNLTSLQHVSLAFNDLEFIPKLTDLTKCVYLDLRGNRIQDGFANLQEASSLRLLDLQKNNIDFTLSQLVASVITPLKSLPKLQYLSFEANPIEVKIKNFRYFIISEFPKLEYYNYVRITKEERSKAAELSAANAFQMEKSNVFSNIVLSQELSEENASKVEDDDPIHRLLSEESITSINTTGLNNSLDSQMDDSPDFAALDNLLDSLEPPTSNSGDDNDDLNALLNDLGAGDDMDIPSFDTPKEPVLQKQESTMTTSFNMEMDDDPLDDILNYLDEPIEDEKSIKLDEPISEVTNNIPKKSNENSKMGVASSQSIANLPVALEMNDEADYFELLGDMINPSTPTSEMESEVQTSDILSMLDDLIVKEPLPVKSEPNQQPISHLSQIQEEESVRDSMEDMLNSLVEEESMHQNNNFTNISKEDDNVRDSLEDMLNSLVEEETSATDTLESILNETSKVPSSSKQQFGETDNGDDLMDLLSEMMDNSEPVATSTATPIENEIDPLDELTNSLQNWDSSSQMIIDPIVEEEKRRKEEEHRLEQEARRKEEEIKRQEEELKRKEQQRIAEEAKRKQLEEQKRIAQEAEAERKKKEEEERQKQRQLLLERQESERKAREEAARKQREELLAREEALRKQRQEEDKRRIAEEERLAEERLKKLEEEELRIERELQERAKREQERREEEERLRLEEEKRKQQDEAERKRREEEEQKRREEEQQRQALLEEKRKEAERKERELREKIERKRQLLLQQQQEEEERKQRETEEMMRILEEEQRKEEEKRLAEEEAERRRMEEKGYVDELVNQVETNSLESGMDDLSQINSSELNELRHMQFPYAIPLEEVQSFELLGGGTFGSCYRGIYQKQEVVLKKLNCNMIQDEFFMNDFKKEVSHLCTLKHSHIVDIKGVSTVDKLAMVTEYIQGTPLFGMLRNRGIVLDISEKIRIAQQIAMGVGYLHRQGVVFNGIKSKNIIINSNSDVILRDFGLQCIKNFTRRQGSIGSPQYTAPEQISSPCDQHNPSEDVFSFGIVLWELFSGKTPYQGMMARQVCVAVTEDGLRPPEPLDCPVIIWKVMQSCWTDNPEARPDFEKLIRILNQPLENIMKYGMTAGSTEHVPRGAPIDTQAAYEAQKSSSSSQDKKEDSKIHIVLKQVTQMLTSQNNEQQMKALKVLVNIGRTESNIEPIISVKIMQMLHSLLKHDDWRIREGSARALGVLCEWPACEKVAREDGIILDLVQNLSHPSEVVVIQSAKTIITLTKEPSSQKAVRACGGLNPLLKLMASSNDMLRLQGVWAFSHLLEDEQFQQDFFEAGGVRSLLMLLGSPNPGIQFRVLVGLGNLISNPRTYPVIEKAGVLKRFLLLLNSKSPVLRLQAAKATERMSSKGALRTEITKNGGMETLVQLLQPENDQELILSGLGCLINFAKDKQQILSFKQAGGLQATLAVLENKIHTIQYQGLRFFASFIENDDFNKEICRAIGFIPRCVGLLTSTHPGIQQTATEVLAELISSNKCVETILSGGGLPPLLALIDHQNDAVKRNAILVIAALVSYDAGVKDTIVSTGSVKKLINLLRAADLKIKEAAAIVLCNLSADVQVKSFLKSLNSIPSFVSILRATQDTKTQESILTAFNNFIRDGDCNQIIMQSGAAETIFTMLGNSDTVIQTAAIRCALLLSINAENKQTLHSFNAIQHLQQINASSPSLKAAATKCISFLQ